MKKIFNKADGPQTVDVLKQLRGRGYRLTRSRHAVVRTLVQSDGWLRPETIHKRAKRLAPKLGLVTVYRTLQLLTELDIVRRVHAHDGCHGYALAEYHHGHHLVCKRCQHVIEFPGTEDLQPLIDQLENTTGFVIEDHVLELTGLCSECQG
jgi:Fe2+ or Zn2+ uptake regulation protein